jgi:hypothetical protein
MNRCAIIVVTAAVAVVMSRGVARAQAPAVNDPTVPDQTIVEGAGVKVGEGTVVHPIVGVETGFVSNVFYTAENTDGAPFLRALVEFNVASLSQQRLDTSSNGTLSAPQDPGDIRWRAGVRIIGQEYITGNSNIDAQHNIAGGLSAHGVVFPQRTWRFAFDEDYIRDNRPTNFESSANLNRDINQLQLQLQWVPADGALSGALRYWNLIDVFERDQDAFSNRIQHLIGLHANWQWLPITKLFADVSLGFFEPLGNQSTRISSMPIRAQVGIETALTTDTTISAHVGWGFGNYATGTSPSQPIVGIQGAWRYSPAGQVSLFYWYDFTDSIQANYFRDHAFVVSDVHQIDRFALWTTVDMRLRNYQFVNIPGLSAPERSDVVIDFGLSPRYFIKDWFAATVDYDLVVDSTDFRYMTDGMTVNPGYVRHQVMAGVRAAW